MQEYSYMTDEEVRDLKNEIPDEIVVDNMSELFKVFADRTRVKILFLLLEREEMCVAEIADCMEMEQSAISHQLRILKQSRLVRYRRMGKGVIYSLCDDHIRTIFDMALEHVGE